MKKETGVVLWAATSTYVEKKSCFWFSLWSTTNHIKSDLKKKSVLRCFSNIKLISKSYINVCIYFPVDPPEKVIVQCQSLDHILRSIAAVFPGAHKILCYLGALKSRYLREIDCLTINLKKSPSGIYYFV